MNDVFETEAIVVGAGVVGLAIAAALARAGRETILLEAAPAFGTETSSRNSEVIHAGLYYRTNSLKARLCVAGRRKLYAHLDRHGIDYNRCGKLVVAVGDEEAPGLEALHKQAMENDVEDVSLISAREALKLEPALNPDLSGALVSETSGIFDSHSYMASLVGEFEDHGGQIAYNTPVLDGEIHPEGVTLRTGGDMPASIKAGLVVNAAGHGAIPLARQIEGPHTECLPTPRAVKGSYFMVSGKTPFSRLIYPMHNETSLGLHLTIDLGGQGRLGPDAEWLSEDATQPFDYEVDPSRKQVFLETVSRYWPGVTDHELSPGYAGVRPKIVGPGEPSGDFRIEGPADHGSAGLVNLFGMESPSLTSSLAIADHVMQILADQT